MAVLLLLASFISLLPSLLAHEECNCKCVQYNSYSACIGNSCRYIWVSVLLQCVKMVLLHILLWLAFCIVTIVTDYIAQVLACVLDFLRVS